MSEYSMEHWIGEINELILHELELHPILDKVFKATLDLTGATDGDILIMGKTRLRLELYKREWEENTIDNILSGKGGIISWVVENLESALIMDVRNEEPWKHIYVPKLKNIRSELTVPILGSSTSLLGIINLEHVEPNAFSAEQCNYVEHIATQVAIAIEKANQYESLKRSEEEMQFIREIEQKMLELQRGDYQGQIGDIQIFEEMLDAALEITGADCGLIALYDASDDILREAAVVGIGLKDGFTQKMGEGIMGKAAQERNPIRVPDVRSQEYEDIYLEVWENTTSELAVPLIDNQGSLIGVINMKSKDLDKFTSKDEDFLSALGNQVLLIRQNQASNQRLRNLLEISQFAITTPDPDEVVEKILQKLLEQANVMVADIVYYNNDGLATGGWAAISHGMERHSGDYAIEIYQIPEERLPIYNGGIMARVFKSGNPYISNDTNLDENYREDPDQPKINSELAVPMKDETYQPFGVLNVESKLVNNFLPDDINFFQAYADNIARVISLSSVRQDLDELRLKQEQDKWIVETAKISANLRHKFSNNLGLLPGDLKDMAKTAANLNQENLQKKLLKASTSIKQALNTISDLQEATNHRQDAIREERVRVRIIDLINKVVESQAWIRNREIRVIIDHSGTSDAEILIPLDPIVHGLGNIIANALQAIDGQDDGEIQIKTTIDSDRVQIHITDNGPGIPQTHQNSIFEFGFTTKQELGGTGYGLWSAKGSIEAVEGTLDLDDSFDKGTSFIITFPLA